MISNMGHTPVSRQKAIWLLDVDFSACESCRESIFSHTATNYCELQSSKDIRRQLTTPYLLEVKFWPKSQDPTAFGMRNSDLDSPPES